MARKSDAPKELSAAQLKSLRSQIDRLDLAVLKLLNERASIASQIGKVKTDDGSPIFNAAREEEILASILSHNKGPLNDVTLRSIYRELISGSRALQKNQKVAFLGPEYSYSHLAAIERFGESVEYMRVGSITAVFEEVSRRHVDLGVVPLENSTDGRIADTLDMFVKSPEVKICAEVRLIVHHNLLANCEQTEIRRVYSKAQALSQCRNWLSKNLPHATLHEVSSTADAARLVQSEPYSAAVASRQAGVRYGLRVLFESIEDNTGNETRFAVIAATDSARTGSDKTAAIFQIPHVPGALANVLQIFKQNKINLTWIESFPLRGPETGYLFFLDFEGHMSEARVKRTLEELEKGAVRMEVLGSYPRSEPVD